MTEYEETTVKFFKAYFSRAKNKAAYAEIMDELFSFKSNRREEGLVSLKKASKAQETEEGLAQTILAMLKHNDASGKIKFDYDKL
jgi:flagellar motor component MotA